MARGARRVFVAVLLEKAGKRAVHGRARFRRFRLSGRVRGRLWMDVAHNYRQLPFVGVVAHGDPEPDLFGGT